MHPCTNFSYPHLPNIQAFITRQPIDMHGCVSSWCLAIQLPICGSMSLTTVCIHAHLPYPQPPEIQALVLTRHHGHVWAYPFLLFAYSPAHLFAIVCECVTTACIHVHTFLSRCAQHLSIPVNQTPIDMHRCVSYCCLHVYLHAHLCMGQDL